MKSNKLTYLLALGLALAFAATGCKNSPTGVTRIPGPPKPEVSTPPAGELPPGEKVRDQPPMSGISPLTPINPADFSPDRAALASQTVRFDFDSSAVKSSEKAHVEAVASYMKGESNVALLIEGYCDERGTEEYNRSLGERRALALREALVADGVGANRITTTTFGEDKPADRGHNEAAWAKNRRGVFVVLTPK